MLWARVPGQKGHVFLDGIEGNIVSMATDAAKQYYNSAEATKFYMEKLGVKASELPRKARLCNVSLAGPDSENIQDLAALPVELSFPSKYTEASPISGALASLLPVNLRMRHCVVPCDIPPTGNNAGASPALPGLPDEGGPDNLVHCPRGSTPQRSRISNWR